MAAELVIKSSAALSVVITDNNSQLTQIPYCPLSVNIQAQRVLKDGIQLQDIFLQVEIPLKFLNQLLYNRCTSILHVFKSWICRIEP
jgi:hypothetical protein